MILYTHLVFVWSLLPWCSEWDGVLAMRNNMAWNEIYSGIGDVFSFFFYHYCLHIVQLMFRTLSYIALLCIPMSSVHPREHAIVGHFYLKQAEIDNTETDYGLLCCLRLVPVSKINLSFFFFFWHGYYFKSFALLEIIIPHVLPWTKERKADKSDKLRRIRKDKETSSY